MIRTLLALLMIPSMVAAYDGPIKPPQGGEPFAYIHGIMPMTRVHRMDDAHQLDVRQKQVIAAQDALDAQNNRLSNLLAQHVDLLPKSTTLYTDTLAMGVDVREENNRENMVVMAESMRGITNTLADFVEMKRTVLWFGIVHKLLLILGAAILYFLLKRPLTRRYQMHKTNKAST